MAWFTSSEIFETLLACLRKGVKVNLILLDSPINFMEYAPDFNRFIQSRGILKISGTNYGFMHHKFCIIDEDYVITGSYNWTYYAETRNIENILVSDYTPIIHHYKKEFQRLYNLIPTTTRSPRYQWTDLGDMDMIDFTELNYEVKQIAKVKRLPIHEVVPMVSRVSVTERPLKTVSKYPIALGLRDDVEIFIPRQTPLPYTSPTEEFYSMSESISCHIFKDISDKEFKTIEDADISKITHGKINQTLQVRFSLHETGDLIVTIYCVETKLAIDVRVTDSKLVEYVD